MIQRTYTHKLHGWTRTAIGDGSSHYRITPTDGSGDRIVAFLQAGTWQNHPNDTRDRADLDRVVLVDGAALPGWALDWLERANAKACSRARDAFLTIARPEFYRRLRNLQDSWRTATSDWAPWSFQPLDDTRVRVLENVAASEYARTCSRFAVAA